MSHPRVESDMMLPFESMETIEEEEEDIDPFKELEVATSAPSVRGANALAELEGSDPLSAFEDDEDSDPLDALESDEPDVEEVVISFEDEQAPEVNQAPSGNTTESTYRLLLETVWVDDILDPSEVELLARKRNELGITFERHLQLVRTIIGG